MKQSASLSVAARQTCALHRSHSEIACSDTLHWTVLYTLQMRTSFVEQSLAPCSREGALHVGVSVQKGSTTHPVLHMHALPVTEIVSVAASAPSPSCSTIHACSLSPSCTQSSCPQYCIDADAHFFHQGCTVLHIVHMRQAAQILPNQSCGCTIHQSTALNDSWSSRLQDLTMRFILQTAICSCSSFSRFLDCLTRHTGMVCVSPDPIAVTSPAD